jgi:hypothetical protein
VKLYHLFASIDKPIPNYTELVKDAPEFRIEADEPEVYEQQYKPIVGVVFGKLKVKESINDKHHCDCQCGEIITLTTDDLLSGKYRSCGCPIEYSKQAKNVIGKGNLTGMIFNYLKVIGTEISTTGKSTARWQCLCICGQIEYYYAYNLKEGGVKSCGCMIHNRESTRLYNPYAANAMNAYRGYKDGDILLKHFVLLSQLNCFYCGKAPENVENKDKERLSFSAEKQQVYRFVYSGLDKINQAGKHNLDNIVPCCKLHNRMKWIRNMDQFRSWIIRVYEYCVVGKLGYPNIDWTKI